MDISSKELAEKIRNDMAIVKIIDVLILRFECAPIFLMITWYIFLSFRQHECRVIHRSNRSSDEKKRVHRKVSPMTIMTRMMFRRRNIRVILYLTKTAIRM